MVIRAVGYDNPDAAKLIAEVQQHYVRIYGGIDDSPVRPAEFSPPTGLFLVGYLAGQAVACGGWRTHDADQPGFVDGDVELKRMYVIPAMQGRGFARQLLAELERTALVAGRTRMVLLTGTLQPEAIGLYSSSGYQPIPSFGIYRDEPECRCFSKPLVAR
ncbi:MAG TPA: GNAT family N-acetyltransferase [Pseudonocardiaceae bacterium]|nr:GNAT family N-acetyltransferase [Pseudonocardiaceae bacterium]